jgi:hypothetical protein
MKRLREAKRTPESRARASAAAIAFNASRAADPAWRAHKVAAAHKMRLTPVSKDVRKRAARKCADTRLAWCPAEYRELNDTLYRKGVLLAERKQMIATEMLRDAHRREMAALAAERARRSAMSPFERQEERLRNGASVVTKFTPRRADPSYTLGGVVGAIA